jgi:hypothetical protein
MNRRETLEPAAARRQDWRSLLVTFGSVVAGIGSVLVANVFRQTLFSDLNNYPLTILLFVWLFGTMMWCAFGVVRHAEAVAERLGEPYGTLVLTLSVIIIEVALLAAIMLHGQNNPTLARDAMFGTLMIVLNGMVGTALLMGALRYWEQEYNLARSPCLPRRYRLACGFRADHSELHQDRARPEPGADEGGLIRIHHRPVLHRVRHYPDCAAQSLLRRTFAQS